MNAQGIITALTTLRGYRMDSYLRHSYNSSLFQCRLPNICVTALSTRRTVTDWLSRTRLFLLYEHFVFQKWRFWKKSVFGFCDWSGDETGYFDVGWPAFHGGHCV